MKVRSWFFDRFMQLVLVLAATSIALETSGEPAAPVDLLVNGVSNPLAIDRNTTRFAWRSPDTGREETQTGYQVLVSPDPAALDAGKTDYWDSGQVVSDKSVSVEYAGKMLPSATRIWWKVRIWDRTGKASPYSAPARFDTGLMQNEWTARYIWDGTSNINNFAYFRKAFSISRKPEMAKVFVSAHNDYLLYCNGQLLGRGPARSDPYCYGQYNAYDVTKLLKTGSNVFAAVGHWLGTWGVDAGVNAKPAFLLEARLGYPDGSTSTIRTDESWKALAHTAFIETNGTYFVGGNSNRAAIQFDSRLEPPDWQAVGFDDSGWAVATVVDRSDYRLYAQMAPMENEQAELAPVSVTFTNGAWMVDFDRCINGWPKLLMHANHSGDAVRVEYFEMAGERNSSGWDQYICHGGTETWKPGMGRHVSFQTFKITGYAGNLSHSDVRGVWAYCDADVAGRFNCSSALLNDVYEMCERSARQKVQQGIISVDANREQAPWLADSWNIGNVLLYNHRNTMMLDKIVRDYAAEQQSNGVFYCCSPSGTFYSADWAMYWPMILWQQYLFSGDETLLREMAPRLEHFLKLMKTYQDPATKLIDPPGPGDRMSDYAGQNLMPSGGYNVTTTSQYYENLRIASRIFVILGQVDQGNEYLLQAEEVKRGINSHLFNGEFYLSRTDRPEMFPLASAWPLRFDIEPNGTKSQLIAAIGRVEKINFGGYSGDAFYSGLFNAGGGEIVVRDLARYLPMLQENKANWEGFDALGEVNHAWTAYPGYLFLKYISGIQPTSGGFATFDVRPETGGLTFAEGTVPTVKGLITTRWEKSADGQFALSVTVPPNTHASIYIPKFSKEKLTIMESGKCLWPPQEIAREQAPEVIKDLGIIDPGVIAISEEDSSIKCMVGAGAYRFNETP